MKKTASIIGLIFLVLTFATAQNREKETPQYSDDLSKQMEQMQRQMAEQMKRMFGVQGNDSTQNFSFSFKDLPFGSMDSSMTQSFGMLFDGKNWQKFSPDSDTSTNESLGKLRDQMPDFGKGFNFEDLFKGFETMLKDGSPMMPNNDNMPRIQPYDKKRKGDEPKQKRKYQTESL